MTNTELALLITAASGILLGLINHLAGRKRDAWQQNLEARQDVRAERINLYDQVESLSKQLKELRDENRSIIQENRRLAQENLMLAGETVRLRTEAERLRAEVITLYQNAEKLRLELIASGTATQQMTAQIGELQGTANRLGKQVDDLREDIIKLIEIKREAIKGE
jgi:regulator of replication initiation timing